ncbi:MAG: ABC transporter substrate-binding protein, partial [Bacteroidales bacterium]|nr:ABC transporter substrate-binding protein [Bacteroidales bacterium]
MNIVFKTRNSKTVARVFSLLLVIGLCTQVLTGCKAQPEANVNNEYYYSFTDALKNTVHLEAKPQRVVSLVGSYAETWLLAGGSLVGVTNDVISERKMDLPEETQMVGTIKDPNLEEVINLSSDFVLLSPDIESHVKIS